MIKVCHMTSVHKSGDIRIFVKECVSLAKGGYDVYLVAAGESREENGVHVIGVGEKPKSRKKRMTAFAKKVYEKALELDCELYHFHDPELLPYALKLKKQGKKVIFDSHEWVAKQTEGKSYLGIFAKIIAKLYAAYENYVLSKIDGVIFPCLKQGRHIFEGKCKNVETVDNFPSLSELYDKYDPQCEKWPKSVCYAGTIAKTRGHTNNTVAAYIAGANYYYAGSVDSEYKKETEALPEHSTAKYLGVLNRSQVLDMFQHCLIGISLNKCTGQYNLTDNLATKVYEYMSLGLPVVLTNSPYNKKMMDLYNFGICVDPEDVNDIAKAIKFLLEHPKEAETMGQNGRKAVREVFNWGNEEIKLLNFYEKILHQN